MLRKTLTILALIGLLLSVGAWGVSYWGIKYFREADASASQYSLVSGTMQVIRLDEETLRGMMWRNDWPQPGVRIQGFDSWRTKWKPHCEMNRQLFGVVVLPFWPLVMLFCSTLWLAWMPLHRRRKRKKLGLCVKCGYDLRGSSERCPECGTKFEMT